METTSALTVDQQLTIKTAFLQNYEVIIRDAAGTTLSLLASRRGHPSYGITKAQIRQQLERMEGMVGAYMVLAGQSAHAGIPLLAKFLSDETTHRVTVARIQVAKM